MNFGLVYSFLLMVFISVLSLYFSSVITNNNNSSIVEQVTENNNGSTVTNDNNNTITMANVDNITKISRCTSENCNTYDITFDNCSNVITPSEYIRLHFNALILTLHSIANARSHFTDEELKIIKEQNLGKCVTNMQCILQWGYHFFGNCEGLTQERINQVAKGYFDACIKEAKENNAAIE
ncbi:hypothetical protein BDAP_001808 [Binucleata daphniae]